MKAASKKHKEKVKTSTTDGPESFTPCSPDMTICGDCEDNRAKNKCPRLREREAKRQG